jgi:hypothetical protein
MNPSELPAGSTKRLSQGGLDAADVGCAAARSLIESSARS